MAFGKGSSLGIRKRMAAATRKGLENGEGSPDPAIRGIPGSS